jgi:fructoselysine-6-P-deglycase FrlB-like protein
MDSLERLAFDFKDQISGLGRITVKRESENVVYIGSGDSYVAGLIAEYFSGHKCKCYSPSDLMFSKIIPDGTYYFVSVSGKTKANIEIAKRATKAGAKAVDITLNPFSELAQVCKETIPLQITSSDTSTSYSTFTANVVTCLKLTGVTIPRQFETWHRNGMTLASDSGSIKLPQSILHILGNNVLYPIAIYASLKMAEFFGVTATTNKLEEFCHSPIFGVKPTHSIWIFGHNEELSVKK